MPRMRIADMVWWCPCWRRRGRGPLGLLDELQVDGEGHVPREGVGAVGEGVLPVEAELAAVDRGGELERRAVVAEGVGAGAVLALGDDGLGGAADRQVTG